MYACKQCGVGNPLDSSFCKKCGAALPDNELVEARNKLAETLEQGNDLFTQGRSEEAMLIAEAAVAANPSSHMAHSLKGLCHERVGQVSEALECYEIAVGLNPDSSLDKVKVAALRNRLAQRVVDASAPSRGRAAMTATAAAVLVLVLGALAANGMRSRDPQKLAANTPTANPLTPTNPLIQADPTQQQAPANSQAQPNAAPATNVPAPQGQVITPPIDLPTVPPGGVLPAPNGTIGNPITTDPIHPPLPDPATNVKPSREIDTPPAPLTNTAPGATAPTTGATTADDDTGYVHITKTEPKRTLGGSEVPDDGTELTAVLKTAQNLFQLGQFDDAAGKYRRVAELGGDSGRLEQRLGDCYRHLARPGPARSAYNRAIGLYQAQIKKGREVNANQRGLDSCESALKVIGG